MGWPRIISSGLLGEKPASTRMSLKPILSKVVVEKDGALMVVNLEHPSNAMTEMEVGIFGMCTEVSEGQLSNIQCPMVVMDGSVTDFNDEHPLKIEFPMVVIEDGSLTEVRDEQSSKTS